MAKTVQCVKLGQELPAMEKAPYPGELGQRLLENVSQEAWEIWRQEQVLIINHYGLILADPNHRAFLKEQMEAYFFGAPESEEGE